jgi:3-polyprenyl-4-hydroxybenzoate decarboxylase
MVESFESFELILVTNNKYASKLTKDIIETWQHSTGTSLLKILDFADSSISSFKRGHKVTKRQNKEEVNNLIEKYDINSFPVLLVIKDDKLIESILCSYDNLLKLIKLYF